MVPMIRSVRASLPRVQTPRDAIALGAALRRDWDDQRIRELVAGIGLRAEAAALRPWGRFDARKRVYDGRKLVDAWTRSATSLITSVRAEVAEGLQRDVVEAAKRGMSPATLAAKWRRQGIPVLWGTLEGRVKVIAQHQLTMLHSQVQRARAESVGVTQFVWRKNTERHAALDGRTFSYTNPETGVGLPGEPINCQCWAESVIPDELLGLRVRGVPGRR
jgi:SPP1 gp7 family putative phage head morphogenesis protein